MMVWPNRIVVSSAGSQSASRGSIPRWATSVVPLSLSTVHWRFVSPFSPFSGIMEASHRVTIVTGVEGVAEAVGEFFALASFFSFCVASFAGAYLISRFRRELRLYLAFSLFALFAVWSLGLAMVQVASTQEEALRWMRIVSLGRGTLYSFFLHWVLFASEKRWVRKAWGVILLYLPAGVNVLFFSLLPGVSRTVYSFHQTPWGWVVSPNPRFWNYFASAYIAVFVLLGVMQLWRWQRQKAQTPQEKRQASFIFLAVLAVFAVAWTVDRIVRVFRPAIYPLPVTSILLLFVFLVIFYTMIRYRVFLALPMRSAETGKLEILDRAKKVRLYSFLSLVYTLDGVVYILYTHFVLEKPLNMLLPWGALFVLFGMGFQYLGTLEVREDLRDLLYVALVSLVALVLSPKIHFLSETLYGLFFFTAVVVAILLGSLRAFVLQGILMGGILLFLWRPVAPLPVEKSFVAFHGLLVAFLLFFVLAFYVHQVYLERLRENQEQLERQGVLGEISARLVEVNHSNFEKAFAEIFQATDRFYNPTWRAFFLFSPLGKNAIGASKWCYGNGCPEGNPDFSEDFFSWLEGKIPSSGEFWVGKAETPGEQDFLTRMNARIVFLRPVKRGKELLGFLGCSTKERNPRVKPCQEFWEALSYQLTDVLIRVSAEKDLYCSAFYDSLTALPNRALFREHLEKAIQFSRRTGKMVGILFVDLDNFKNINDAEGHEMGDELLQAVAQRLSGCVREHDTVARFGGDEFLVLLTELHAPEEVLPIVERIRASFRQPFTLHNQEFFLTASIGIALYPGDGETPQELIKNADLAMYSAKAQQGDGYAFCSPAMKESALEKQRLISGLYRALEREELLLYYQPQVNARSGKIVGLEALLRWKHPEMGILHPASFIPLAEQTGLIIPIGEWVLRTTCETALHFQSLGIPPLSMAVNLSAVQIRDPELPAKVERVLRETGFNPHYLELEITESTIFQNPENVIGLLKTLKALGVRVTLDDFGTGYSFLARLKMLPVDRIKIDRHFLQGIPESEKDRTIVRNIIHLARSLGADITAEGVENEAQLAFLLGEGCEEIQGYYYYRPLPPEELETILRASLKTAEG